MITIPFVTNWGIRTPVVLRYLDKESYVNDFFDKGVIRLSSFPVFRNHPDEQRGDKLEGLPAVQWSSPNASGTFLGVMAQESYVLCGTTHEGELPQASFGTRFGFRILNTLGFAQAISRHIPGFVGGIEGLCNYSDDGTLQAAKSQPYRPVQPNEDPEEHGRKLHQEASAMAREALFVKAQKFAHQAEYRFIWMATGTQEKFLMIECPEARQFCQRYSPPSN